MQAVVVTQIRAIQYATCGIALAAASAAIIAARHATPATRALGATAARALTRQAAATVTFQGLANVTSVKTATFFCTANATRAAAAAGIAAANCPLTARRASFSTTSRPPTTTSQQAEAASTHIGDYTQPSQRLLPSYWAAASSLWSTAPDPLAACRHPVQFWSTLAAATLPRSTFARRAPLSPIRLASTRLEHGGKHAATLASRLVLCSLVLALLVLALLFLALRALLLVATHARGILAVPSPTHPRGSGYYRQGARQHGLVEFTLRFSADGRVLGEGSDDVGHYTITGRHRAGKVAFCKQYEADSRTAGGHASEGNKGHAVEYRGAPARVGDGGAVSLSGGVRGTWSIRHELHGDFDGAWHMWPVMRDWNQGREGGGGSGSGGGIDGGGEAAGDDEEESECCVCYDRAIDTCLQPCGHAALCRECATRLPQRRCPLCRAEILDMVPSLSTRRRS